MLEKMIHKKLLRSSETTLTWVPVISHDGKLNYIMLTDAVNS